MSTRYEYAWKAQFHVVGIATVSPTLHADSKGPTLGYNLLRGRGLQHGHCCHHIPNGQHFLSFHESDFSQLKSVPLRSLLPARGRSRHTSIVCNEQPDSKRVRGGAPDRYLRVLCRGRARKLVNQVRDQTRTKKKHTLTWSHVHAATMTSACDVGKTPESMVSAAKHKGHHRSTKSCIFTSTTRCHSPIPVQIYPPASQTRFAVCSVPHAVPPSRYILFRMFLSCNAGNCAVDSAGSSRTLESCDLASTHAFARSEYTRVCSIRRQSATAARPLKSSGTPATFSN